MKARVKATGEIWTFSQIDDITFKSAINGNLYDAEELEFLEPSVFSPDYWERIKHQAMIAAMQAIITNPIGFESLRASSQGRCMSEDVADIAKGYASALVNKMKEDIRNENS